MRRTWGLVHRYVGLFIAGFLFLAGTTGALISWDEELDAWLNPNFYLTASSGPYIEPFELAKRIEAADPRAWVKRMPLSYERDKPAMFIIMPRGDPATGRLHELTYNELYFNPTTGVEVGRRKLGKAALDRPHFVAFLYKLHYTLHLPDMLGIDRWGYWLMGGIALVWALDCFVGLYLTFPKWREARSTGGSGAGPDHDDFPRRGWMSRWRRSWTVRTGAGSYRFTFDLHRAAGLWMWLVLFIISFTAASQNLFTELFRPALKAVSSITPGPYDALKEQPLNKPVYPKLSFREAADIAKADAMARGWAEPAARIFYDQRYGYYSVSFYFPGEDRGTGGMGMKRTFFDATDGRLIGQRIPWHGTAADVFMQMQFPVHSGRILGLPGRIMMSVMGLVVAGLSLTGVIIWFRKRRARTRPDRETTTPRLKASRAVPDVPMP